MLGGLWLNKAPSRGIINAMWVSLIKWHGDKLMCSSEDRSLRIPPHASRECPGRPSGHVVSPIQQSSQGLNINLPLCLSPDRPWCLVCRHVSPSLAAQRRRRRWRKGKSLFVPAVGSIQPDSHYPRLQRSGGLSPGNSLSVCGLFPPGLSLLILLV